MVRSTELTSSSAWKTARSPYALPVFWTGATFSGVHGDDAPAMVDQAEGSRSADVEEEACRPDLVPVGPSATLRGCRVASADAGQVP